MTVEHDTRKLYNSQATNWSRNEPILLSDYSARPFVLDLCEPLQGKTVLDVGCGEGYVSREMKKRGASNILGIDISEKMIQSAIKAQEDISSDGIEYRAQDICDSDLTDNNEYDLVLAMFLFNYLSVEDTQKAMSMVYKVLRPGGHFIFSVPHPLLAYLKEETYPFYFSPTKGYFTGKNSLFPGEIWRRDGVSVDVQCVHKTIADYFSCLGLSGFTNMPELYELHITDEHIELDNEFFGPLRDLPLHITIKVKK